MENFLVEEKDDIVIETVNLVKATSDESEEFKNILFDHISSGKKKFIIDLKHCEFIDSTFLSTLIITLKELLKNGGTVKLTSLQEEVESVFEATGVQKVFKIYPDTDSAVKSFEADQF